MHPQRYAIMAMLSETSVRALHRALEPLAGFVGSWTPVMEENGVAPPHASLVYLSHHDRYPKRYVENRLPGIREALEASLPVRALVKGVHGSWTLGWDRDVLLLDFDTKALETARALLVRTISDSFPHLTEADTGFRMHVGIALLDITSAEDRHAIDSFELDVPIVFDSAAIFYEDGVETVWPGGS